jgi:uncharacterized membrane protein
MRIFLFALLTLALSAFTAPADAAAKSGGKSGAKNANARACASIRSDMHHKGGGYIPPGVTCGKKRKVV